MLQFFKYVLATIAGLFLFFVLSIFLLVGIGSAFSGGDSEVSVKENSVLKLNLNQQIVENAPSKDPFEALFENTGSKVGLVGLKSIIANAKLDPNIKGIYLQAENPNAGYATFGELRSALLDFKKSGKFIYSYGEMMSEPGVYLNSVADRIFLSEWAGIEFNGLHAQTMYFTGLFKKLGVKPEIFKVGEYKSAVEPFFRTSMSAENRLQVTSYVNSIANHIYGQIADSRDMSFDEITEVLNANVQSAEEALEKGIITDVAYYDEFEDALREELDLKEGDKISIVDSKKYASAKKMIKPGDRNNRIAVIVGQGDIVSGKGDNSNIASDSWVAELRKAVKDKKVKAIILRINSGGGSALASDVMWREIEIAKKSKPVYASMGDYAASGGYYMAMACDTIIANPTTLTGSIGIFGILVNAKELLNNKLGLTFDGVESHEHSEFATSVSEMSKAEKMTIQKYVENGYERFTSKAAAGRGMDLDDLKAIAGGRVWTGEQAIENGLVDILGSLDDAIALAAEKADIEDDYRVRYYPTPKSDFEMIIEKLNAQGSLKLKEKLGFLAPYLDETNALLNMERLQARIPYVLDLD